MAFQSKRKHYSLQGKNHAIISVQNKRKIQKEIMKELGAKQSTVNGWFNQPEKYKIIRAYESNTQGPERKRFRKSKYEDIDESLYEWLKDAMESNIPINGPILMQKAEDFEKLFKNNEFHPNNGWLERFKQRYSITYITLNGESRKVDQTSTEN